MGRDGRGVVEGRNRFFPGEELELIGPDMRQAIFPVEPLESETGQPLTVAQPNARILMALPKGACAGDLLRRENRADAPGA
ncbi:MAG: U32 family peptidase C-terminal domain-containing protein [Syntrophotaleaceae bacterium]